MLNKEQILAAGKLTCEPVAVPELVEPLLVWTMTGLEHDRFDAETFSVGADGKAVFNHDHYRARLFIATVKDEGGTPVFTASDITAVSAMSTAMLDKVMEVARRLNGLTTADIEEAAKN